MAHGRARLLQVKKGVTNMSITDYVIEQLDGLADWELLHILTLAEDCDPHDINRIRHLGENTLHFIPLTDEAEEYLDIHRLGKAVNAKITALRNR